MNAENADWEKSSKRGTKIYGVEKSGNESHPGLSGVEARGHFPKTQTIKRVSMLEGGSERKEARTKKRKVSSEGTKENNDHTASLISEILPSLGERTWGRADV